MDTEIVVAIIAATAVTVGNYLTYKNARAAKEQVTPSNGTKLAKIVERNSERLDDLYDAHARHADRLIDHIADYDLHQLEGRHVCPNCLTIEDE